MEEEIAAKAPLVAERFMERTHLLELERTLETQKARREELIGERAQTRERIAELGLAIQNIRNRYQREANTELGRVQSELFAVEDRLRPVSDQLRRLEITSPVDGVVVGRKVHTPGGVIAPREPLMDILPAESPLVVQAKIDVQQISRVRVGQPAELVLSSFKQRTTPRARGTVTYVSADRLVEQSGYNAPPYYQVDIEIDKESLRRAIGDESLLSAGMPVEVYIQTKSRTILAYLLEPITSGLRRALKEE